MDAPEKWKVLFDTETNQLEKTVRDVNGGPVATIHHTATDIGGFETDESKQVREARSHTIAAAPELLACAKRYVKITAATYGEMGKGEPTNTQYWLCKEAIAKAEGK